MQFSRSDLQKLLFKDLLEALDANKPRITEMVKAEALPSNGLTTIDGISFDILPWHRFVAVSFRIWSDHEGDAQLRYSPADWKHYEFIGDDAFQKTRDSVGAIYEKPPAGLTPWDVSHVIYTAAAEALLAPEIALFLQSCGIYAPLISDEPPEGNCEYLVLDEDRVINVNYCGVVIANRITQRLIKALEE